MGHLINPIGLRLGYKAIWNAEWYVNHIYYPQYLHKMYKIKLFFLYILRQKLIKTNLGLIYSHIRLIKQRRVLSIFVFNYYSLLEIRVQEFIMQEFFFIKKLIRIKKRAFFAQYGILFLLLYLLVFPNFIGELDLHKEWNWTIWKKKKMYQFIKLMDPNFIKLHLEMWNVWPFSLIDLTMRSRFLYLLGFFQKFFFESGWDFWDSILEFCSYCLYIRFFKDWIEEKIKILVLIFSYFFNLKCSFNFIRFRNDEVTPIFLARYLALKLVQKFTVNNLIYPLKNELRVVASRLRKPNKIIKNSIIFQKEIANKIYKNIFIHFNKIYKNIFIKYYMKENFWITFEIFFTFIQFKKNKIFLNYINVKSLYFFLYEMSTFKFNINNLLNQTIIINFNMIINQLSYYFYYNLLWTNYQFYSLQFIQNCIALKLQFFIYLTTQNYFSLNSILQINKKRTKINNRLLNKNNILMGFKLQFVGRFSRKQRAGSYWIREGLVPLNSVGCNIEFSMYTVPIINSAVTVKVWFYKQYPKGEIANYYWNLFSYETISK